MKRIPLSVFPTAAEEIQGMLEAGGIGVNPYAEAFLAHPGFPAREPGALTVVIAPLRDVGFETGATLEELLQGLAGRGLRPCPPCTGLFLRLAWQEQPQSGNSVLTGTHSAPDQSVTVLSEPLERRDDFPKGLYLRHVDGRLWLRGYVCDGEYRFPPDTLFAFAEEDGLLTAHTPAYGELAFRERMLSDPETMAYNRAWGGTVPFPEARWEAWYSRWVLRPEGERYYRYLVNAAGEPVGEIAWHYDAERDAHLADVIVHAAYRGRGYGSRGLTLLCGAARSMCLSALWDDIALDNPALSLFLRHGFEEVGRGAEAVTVRRALSGWSAY